jgi:hypothetical protein
MKSKLRDANETTKLIRILILRLARSPLIGFKRKGRVLELKWSVSIRRQAGNEIKIGIYLA